MPRENVDLDNLQYVPHSAIGDDTYISEVEAKLLCSFCTDINRLHAKVDAQPIDDVSKGEIYTAIEQLSQAWGTKLAGALRQQLWDAAQEVGDKS